MCVILRILVFPEVTEMQSQRSVQVSSVKGVAAEADGAAHHSRQSQDSQQDDPPMSLQREIIEEEQLYKRCLFDMVYCELKRYHS